MPQPEASSCSNGEWMRHHHRPPSKKTTKGSVRGSNASFRLAQRHRRAFCSCSLLLCLLASCGSRPGDLSDLTATVSGLIGGGLVLRLNGTCDVPVSRNGAVTLASMPIGTRYTVTVRTQPSAPPQMCTVLQEAGVLSSATSNIEVSCEKTYAVGGSVSGLDWMGLVLRSSLGDDLLVPAGATSFIFPTRGLAGADCVVTVETQPSPRGFCTVNQGATKLGDTDMLDVVVVCSAYSYKVGGQIEGLAGGSTVVLQNNSGDDLSVANVAPFDGMFEFERPVALGAEYRVTVATQPTNPWQTCTVSSGTATMGAADVTGVKVKCATNSYTVSGSVSGLRGEGLVLQALDLTRGGITEVAVSPPADTLLALATMSSGTQYEVAVKTQPTAPAQTCTVQKAGPGTVRGAGVAVPISCHLPFSSAWMEPIQQLLDE